MKYIEGHKSQLVSNLTFIFSLNSRIWGAVPAVIDLRCFWVTLLSGEKFGKYFQGIFVRGDLQEDFVVNDGFFPCLADLAVLFNLSLLSGVFPCVWRESYIYMSYFFSVWTQLWILHCSFIQEWWQKKCFELSWNILYSIGDS
jgi:hypothetical protein